MELPLVAYLVGNGKGLSIVGKEKLLDSRCFPG